MKISYIVQSFSEEMRLGKPTLVANTPRQVNTKAEAISRAQRDAERFTGVIALSQEYDDESNEFGRMEVLLQAGTVPEGILGD
ncbi:MAG: hypothetical protein ACTJHL_09440 [Neisseriaceae bacterium]